MDQHEFPGRALLPDGVLYSRRARVLALAASMFVVAIAVVPLLGIGRVFGVSWIAREVGVELPAMALLPLGVLALPFALLASNVINDLFGRSRGLLIGAAFAWVGVLAIVWATDSLPAFDGSRTNAFWIGLALVGTVFVTSVVQIEVFAWIRKQWLRHVVAPVVGVAAGFGAFAVAATQLAIPGAPAGDEFLGLALGSGGYVVAVVLACTPLVVMLTRALAVYTRVELRARRRRRGGIDVDDGGFEPAFVKRPQQEQRAWTSQEMAFFDAGDSHPHVARAAER